MSAHQRYLAQHHFGSLNGLRCLCIAAVLWHHSPVNGQTSDFLLAQRGFVGVDFFFVLSGFLITTLLLREQDQKSRISLSAFYWRRALRILPAYLLLVSAVSSYYIFYKGQCELGALLPYYYFFLANFLQGDIPFLSVTWSLSIEEQYYLLWPMLLVVLPALPALRIVVLSGMILICLAVMLGIADFMGLPRITTKNAIFSLPAMSYMAILMGSLLAVLLHDRRGYQTLSIICATRAAPFIMFPMLLTYLQMAPGNLRGWPTLGMDALMALCVAALVMREDHFARPVMLFRPVSRIGEISYGLYLYHLIGLHFAHLVVEKLELGESAHSWLVSALFPILSIIIAEISFRWFERYFLSWKNVFGVTRRGAGPFNST